VILPFLLAGCISAILAQGWKAGKRHPACPKVDIFCGSPANSCDQSPCELFQHVPAMEKGYSKATGGRSADHAA